ncbi:UDP-N-acetylglucosamine 1-carboxyvinyltransferase [Pelagicoccus sp. SDUM812005]|uniref:UDP-N-acetylglucosamine 1-carboxyvinyltransferase n=1 Tax=Pelagicoccus sp. SDUM812005 TaxID=3041257 RepID=UPI00280FD399|nr:UDP-N-acetylglucosamine 1-carboxyvinyltransferase [Pelagicoccus sp. SDUM812005]MDQ8183732.1 UDP-N-acetylglucosamine 1-carboxyvinyltransferase [Pelagicoccus sp. SDUM812005]
MNNTLRATGPQTPNGEVTVSGAKNAATRMLAASMLTDSEVTLLDFPTELVDARYKANFIEAIGGKVLFDPDASTAKITSADLSARKLEDYNFPIRTTYLLAAGQLMRENKAFIPYPGGCKLGERKYDLHIMVWEQFGCTVKENPDCIEITGTLKGANIHFPISTVGGTENAILCASVAEGKTTIHNAYVTPEITNLIELLRLMGAQINVDGTSHIEIQGVQKLNGASIRVVPDRIEAITWIIFAAITGGKIIVNNVPFDLMQIPLAHLRISGLDYMSNSSSAYVGPDLISETGLQPFEIACGTHPGVISDMQPFYVMLALHSAGRSKVFDYRYPDRTAYLEQLAKSYVNDALSWKNGEITINGKQEIKGATMSSTDLRGSMAMVMAAFTAQGESEVKRCDMALRGYDQLGKKLKRLGLKFEITEE